MPTDKALVCLVDDDESVRESLAELMQSCGYRVLSFASAEAFLCCERAESSACLILDMALPGISGLALQEDLARRSWNVPVVVITSHSSERLRERALALGAVAYLLKPFSPAVLLDTVASALADWRRCRPQPSVLEP